jgi:NAD+ synthase (glutamine-hydrolysing)
MEETLRIALAQINPTVGDLSGNTKKISSFIKHTQEFKADIVIFPELAICGYPPEDLLLKEYFVRDNLKALDSLVEEVHGIIAIIGFVDQDRQRNLYNAAGVIHNAKIKGVYRKVELPNYGVFDEKRYFQPGADACVFMLGNVLFGVNICEDIWKAKGIARLQAERGARLIINISASPYHRGKVSLRKRILTEQAKETDAFICYCNLVGGQDELVFDGGSLILNPEAEEVAVGKQFEEDLLVADLVIRGKQRAKSGYKNYVKINGIKKTKKPGLSQKEITRLDSAAEIYYALVLGTRDYIRKNGFQKAVIGLSGGIDSCLTAVIACDAIGNNNVIGISMPSRYSSPETKADAKILANNLSIKFITVSIDNIFAMYLLLLEKEFIGLGHDATEENLQARIRGNILMAFSNKFGWIVLTTGNKSETSVGYCTLYGDMAGGFAVIKDVPKTLVYELARFRNEKENKRLIPESVFAREPSAELKLGQKDQDTLPPYATLDVILKKYIEENKDFTDIISSGRFNPEIVKSIIRMVDRNEYKRRQGPPGIKITPKAFGKDRRFPITNRYKEY